MMGHFSFAKYIQAIADMRNISAAADQLGISQPALSAQLKKLEDQLGVLLFDRTKQPLEMTEAGRIYLQYARKYQALQNEFMQHIADIENLQRGHLTVGGAGSFNISYLPDAAAEFTLRYPGIQFEVVDGSIPDISMKALNGQIDLFIAPPWNRDERFQYETLLQEKIFLCVPPKWEINRDLKEWQIPIEAVLKRKTKQQTEDGRISSETLPQVDFTKFKDLPFVLLKEDQHIGHIMASLFERYRFDPVRYTITEQTMTSYSLTLAGVGISLMTESTIKNSCLDRYPILYMADNEICRRTMYVAYSKHKYLSGAAERFIAILKDTLRTG